jgi:hypothetical protein
VISFGKNYFGNCEFVTEIKNFYDLYKLYRINDMVKNNQIELKKFLINAYYNSYGTSSNAVMKHNEDTIEAFSESIMHYLNNNKKEN